MAKKVLIIGGVAAGAKAASRIMRRDPEMEVTILERGEIISYGACGLPFFIEDRVKNHEELITTPTGVIRNPVFFKNVKGVTVHIKTEAKKIDRKNKIVSAINLNTGEELEYPYDSLVLAVGGTPVVPPIDGVSLKNINKLSTIEDGIVIKEKLAEKKIKQAVIVGAGLIGLEMIDALKHWGADVTVVEMLDTVLPALLDKDMGLILGGHLKNIGVRVLNSEAVVKFEGDENGNVKKVITNKNELDADMVLMAIGVRPNIELAKNAGLEIGESGAIFVNEYLQTSDPSIYAGGDCAENTNLLTGKKVYAPMGSVANKHGRIIADHIIGNPVSFPGILQTGICKVCGYNVGRTGLSEKDASALGFDVETIISPAPDRPHFYPGNQPIIIKLVADKKTKKILGVQVIGPGDVAKRVDVVGTALTFGATAEQLSSIDLAYAPPFSPALDNIITAAHVMMNKLSGLARGVSPLYVKEKLDNNDDFILLDVRSPDEYNSIHIEHPNVKLIPLGKLREEAKNLPVDKEIIAFCKISLRGYEAQRILDGYGFKDVKFMDGGVLAWPFDKITAD